MINQTKKNSTPKQTPLGINVQSSFLQNIGLNINPVAAGYMGASKTNPDYSFGSICNSTHLYWLTYAINDAYNRGVVSSSTYDNLISIGKNVCEALGNTKPPTYDGVDPSDSVIPAGSPDAGIGEPSWYNAGIPSGNDGPPATTGYGIAGQVGQGQDASWINWAMANPNNSVTQWGFVRCWALQAWNEFNWNGIPAGSVMPHYKDFLSSFQTASGFVGYSNVSISALSTAQTYLKGVYSNMNDLCSADITGITLATAIFGQDCITAGKSIDLSSINKFGLPSVLLQTIEKQHAMSQSLTLALLSAGFAPDEVTAISSGNTVATPKQEQQLYGAYMVIVGADLQEVLVPLNCKTKGLTSLADLLSVRKLFPNSYTALTVPVYNTTPGPNNSKTYYPIFEGKGVSSRLLSTAIAAKVGTTILPGEPPIAQDVTLRSLKSSSAQTPNKQLKVQPPPTGFGSYLAGIIPQDIAVAAGAFSMAIQQVRNIQKADFETFAQVASSIEVVANGLNLVNGTDVPVSIPRAQADQTMLATGSGPDGTFTYSDIFGCMSGLPYSWSEIQKGITNLQTTKLGNIYSELYLATTWEAPSITVTYSTYTVGTDPVITYYHVTGLTVTNKGGGYGRGTGPRPIITISNGGSAIGIFGTNKKDCGSTGTGTYGRITGYTSFNSGSDTTSIPTVTIEYPPTATLPVQTSGSVATWGTNSAYGTAGWPGMNSVVQAYIAQANAEIISIKSTKTKTVKNLNSMWNQAGAQLEIEQRTRYSALTPVPIPRSVWLSNYPTTTTSFVDAISTFASQTKPHMAAQTLEAISNLSTVGGQSLVAMMRQERNTEKLSKLNVPAENIIPGELKDEVAALLSSNGTVPNAKNGIAVTGINGNLKSPTTIFTSPASLLQQPITGSVIAPKPFGYFNPNINKYILTPAVTPISEASPIMNILNVEQNVVNNTNLLGPASDGTGPALPTLNSASVASATGLQSGSTGTPKGPTTILANANAIETIPIAIITAGPSVGTGEGIPMDIGEPEFPGSLAISAAIGVLPLELNSAYTSAVLLPTTLSVQDAIDEVIKCHCDCWVE